MSNTINYSNGGLTVTQSLNGLTTTTQTNMGTGGAYTVLATNPDGTQEQDSYASGLLTDSEQLDDGEGEISDAHYDYNPNETLKDSIDYTGQTNYTYFQDGTEKSVQAPGQTSPQQVTAIDSGTEDPTGVTNPNNSTSSQSENALGQTTQQSGAGIIASEFGYNADGQLTTLTTFPSGSVGSDYENAATTTWDYDPATGLMTSKTYNDGTSDQYKYNAAGQLKTVIEPGMSESVGYDSAGQQTSYTAIDSQTGLVSSQVMAEDDQGRPIVTTSVDDGQIATETNSYTALGQPQTESFGAAGNVTVAHSYYPTAPGQNDPNPQNESPDALASMTIQNLPNGQANAQTTYGYDPTSKRLQTITVNGVTFTIAYVSGSTSQIGSITTSVAGQAGSAVTTTLTPYSGANGNASMLGGISVTASGSTLYNATLGYNTNGQIATDSITSTNTSGASQTNDYAYTYGSGPNDNGEDANSLTNVTDNGNTTESYSYDGVGNFTDSSLGAVNALNQYAALSYNLRGDVTNDGIYAYTYDANDRMISVTPDDPDATGAQKLTYGYDSQGRRIWKNVYTWDDANDSWDFDYSRSYVYDGTQLVGELNTTGQLVTGYTWSPSGQLLAVTDYTQATPKTYVAVIDASGNTAMLVDPTNGTVAASYTYDSYGNLLSATGPAQAICSILGKGLYYDIEARSIGHALNRDIRNNIWYERDPAGELAGGLNLYQPYGGDPIDLSDTSGTAPDSSFDVDAQLWRNAKYLLTHPMTALGFEIESAIPHRRGNEPSFLNDLQAISEAANANYHTVDNEFKLADQSTAQGSANALNGMGDTGIAILNTPASVYNAVANLVGSNSRATIIVASDWSRGVVIPEGANAHAVSKFLGGNGTFLAITAGGGALLTPGTTAARAFALTNSTLNFANGTASGLNAINDFRSGNNGRGTADASVAALNFAAAFIGLRGTRPPVTALEEVDEGVVYLRSDATGILKPYVGQSMSWARYLARQAEHANNYPNAFFKFTELERAAPGTALDVAEESWIRQLGGPTNKSNPGGLLSNKRYQMSDFRYEGAGGAVSKP